MPRRTLSLLRAVSIIVFIGLLLYGFFSYQEQYKQFLSAEERADRLKRQLDTYSSQLEALFEQKSAVDKSLELELNEHKKTKTELWKEKHELELNCMQEKTELTNQINAANTENQRLQIRVDDLQNELTKVQNKDVKLAEDQEKLSEQHRNEYLQLKQEKEKEISQLTANLASVKQQYRTLEVELKVAQQQNKRLEDEYNAVKQKTTFLESQKMELRQTLQKLDQLNQQLLKERHLAGSHIDLVPEQPNARELQLPRIGQDQVRHEEHTVEQQQTQTQKQTASKQRQPRENDAGLGEQQQPHPVRNQEQYAVGGEKQADEYEQQVQRRVVPPLKQSPDGDSQRVIASANDVNLQVRDKQVVIPLNVDGADVNQAIFEQDNAREANLNQAHGGL